MKALGANERVFELLQRRPAIDITVGRVVSDVQVRPRARVFPVQQRRADPQGVVEFKNVSFRYPSRPDSAVLRGLSFSLKCALRSLSA
jgi:ABC-type multidrug transport system fused ATPase/permease subunit